jgi:hypothetical protein
MRTIETNLSNSYGQVVFIEEAGKYYITLEDHDGEKRKEITKDLFDAAEKVNWG